MQSVKAKFASSWQTWFRNPIRPFGVVSLVLLIVLAIAPAKNHFSEWRHYQHQYLALIRDRGDALTLQRHFQGGIRQIWLPQLGVVDRCQSCHTGLAETSLVDVSTQPFRKHPVIPHTLDEFGCVMCHRGQGAATTVAEAHHSTLAQEEPILPARYIESSCGQCHHAPLAGTPKLNQGRELLARYGCVRCHSISLPDGSAVAAADAPPPLTHIADKTSREWIYAWLKDPSSYSASATMPNFELSGDDARDIASFLIANSVPAAGDTAGVAAAQSQQPADPAAGASLYGEAFCASCHAVQNAAGNLVGGDIGPELTRIGSKVKPEWLQAWLRDPRTYNPNTPMPHYRWTDQQLSILTGYLESKTDSDLLANVHLGPATPKQVAHGKALVMEYGCASCHEIGGIRKPDNFAPDLSRVGSKPVAQLVFLSGMQHTLPEYLAGKIRHPRAFGPGLRMPQYSFTPAQVDALTTALLSLTDRSFSLPSQLQTPPPRSSHYEPAGKAGQLMAELDCFACHRINGRGGDMAPDLTWEGTAVQRQWLDDFLKNPNTLRPALIRRMPKFNLSDSERVELTDYIMTVYQTPAFDRDSMPLSGYSPALVEQGRQLFYSKYACQACHIVNTHEDKGYIGPPLTEVGARLSPAWIYHWLKDPQALRPGTIEPNQGISDQDARALTAFLMAQKAPGTQEAKK
ncbi:MAG TPA: c-type cytochrome [Acidobacteriaceae bacterium]|nr:c-type cytochrome [Acidobacteriaceae bacterium]